MIVVELIMIDVNIRIVFHEVNVNDGIVNAPRDAAGHIIPRRIGIIVHPIAVALGQVQALRGELNGGGGCLIAAATILRLDVHVAAPGSFERQANLCVLRAGRQREQGQQHAGERGEEFLLHIFAFCY